MSIIKVNGRVSRRDGMVVTMSYIDQNLLTGERVVYRTNLHKIVFFWPVVIAGLALLVWSEGADAGLTCAHDCSMRVSTEYPPRS